MGKGQDVQFDMMGWPMNMTKIEHTKNVLQSVDSVPVRRQHILLTLDLVL